MAVLKGQESVVAICRTEAMVKLSSCLHSLVKDCLIAKTLCFECCAAPSDVISSTVDFSQWMIHSMMDMPVWCALEPNPFHQSLPRNARCSVTVRTSVCCPDCQIELQLFCSGRRSYLVLGIWFTGTSCGPAPDSPNTVHYCTLLATMVYGTKQVFRQYHQMKHRQIQ